MVILPWIDVEIDIFLTNFPMSLKKLSVYHNDQMIKLLYTSLKLTQIFQDTLFFARPNLYTNIK